MSGVAVAFSALKVVEEGAVWRGRGKPSLSSVTLV
jgi:hypothetical protein